ncbi:hypothetical protein RD792_016826 [Penstemon davidsonii]|uniref:Uncharacterized protein n=1 Tax=Penstemon davidsonii TaxID=160366 RepID=A0ABR0CKZ3_9LAMI|nr:hypothetical protein RD792_016826 [Penstemon davidsonii]
MGTQIQANAFLRDYQYTNSMKSLYHDNSIVKNGQHPDSLTSPIYQNGYFGYDTEIVRQTIIKHELIFKNQVQELHRIYRRQRDLMNEMKRREITKANAEEEKIPSVPLSTRSNIFPKITFDLELPADVYMTNVEKQMQERNTNHQVSYDRDTKSSLSARWTPQSNNDSLKFNLFPKCDNTQDNLKDFFPKRRNDQDSFTGSRSPLDNGKSLYQRKRTIFGVEISEGNDGSWDRASNTGSTILKKDLVNSESSPTSWIHNSLKQKHEFGGSSKEGFKDEVSCQNRFSYETNTKWFQGCSSIGLKKDSEQSQKFQKTAPQNSNGGLPWFLRSPQNIDVPNKETKSDKKSSYFMNLDSLQNCSQKFFGQAEKDDTSFQNFKQKKEISAPMTNQNAEGGISEVNRDTSSKMILGFPISNMLQRFKDSNSGNNLSKANSCGINDDREVPVNKNENNQIETKGLDLKKGLNNDISTLRHHIDLNLSLDEDDAPLAPSLPTTIVKIATTEIDLEAPAVIESEPEASPKEANSMQKSEIEECDKNAAEAIIAISLSTEPPKAASNDRLKWLAEIISSQNGASDEEEEEDSFPNGMDYFEFMTLKLKDTKEENYLYNPMIFNNRKNEETQGDMFSKRTRKGRGRHRRDFQTEILPGLVTLSRSEVTEDIQAFEELVKAEGRTWNLSKRNSTRKGRGRKRLASPNTSPRINAHCSSKTQQLVCGELGFKAGNLTGWGKRTRRVPRQR